MIESTNETEIRAEPCPTCAVCGEGGDYIYLKQQDKMFGAPGEWNLKRCSNQKCQLIWLDPMPLEEDIGNAYACYYTHVSSGNPVRPGMLKREYLADIYNYPFDSGSSPILGLRLLLRLFPFCRTGADGYVRFLSAVPHGCLLDVGCGSGDWLLSMRELGWEVTGVDFDKNAVRVGRERGLTIHSGALEQLNFPNDSFDAITLNHVIEHVPNPVETLRECLRILKPNGKLVVFTPNGSSLGHRIFKEYWRGLESPRHLHIFTHDSIYQALRQAGYQNIAVLPWVAASSIIYESYLLRRGWRGSFANAQLQRPIWFFAQFFAMAELLLIKWKASVADCVVAIAVK